MVDTWLSGCMEMSTQNIILASQLCTPDAWTEYCDTDLCNTKRDWSAWRPPTIDPQYIRYSSPSTTTFDITWEAPENCMKLEYRLVYFPLVNQNDKKEIRTGNQRFVTLENMQPARQYRLEVYTIAPGYQYESLPYVMTFTAGTSTIHIGSMSQVKCFKKTDLGQSEIETVCAAGEICQSKYAKFWEKENFSSKIEQKLIF